MDIMVSISDAQMSTLDGALKLEGATAAQKREAYKKFCSLALSIGTDWVSGKARYRSLSEVHLEVVQKLYEQLLPEELPSADHLFNRFNLPPGQAAYIARILTDKDVVRWRTAALKELRATIIALRDAHADVANADAKDTFAQDEISLRAHHELMSLCNGLKRKEGNTFVMAESVGRSGDFRRVRMTVTTLRRIHKLIIDGNLGA